MSWESRLARVAQWSVLGIALARCTPFRAGPSTEGPLDAGGEEDASSLDGSDDGCEACDGGLDGDLDGKLPSCKALHEARPMLPNGVYPIASDGGPLFVYCDMTSDEGGWTLAGRSAAADPVERFGWLVRTGKVTDDAQPYSLDVSQLGFEPTEVLFGSRGSSKAWGENVYKVILPPGFWINNQTAGTQVNLIVVGGNCPGGQMHSHMGHTRRVDGFFFRDKPNVDEMYGLSSLGWNANSSDSCDYASSIGNLQGMIFVR